MFQHNSFSLPREAAGQDRHFVIARQDEGWLMNPARTIVTNETDIFAIDAMNTGDFGEATPSCAVICGDVAVDRLDVGRIRKDHTDVIASHCRTWAGEFRAPSHSAGTGAQARGPDQQGP